MSPHNSEVAVVTLGANLEAGANKSKTLTERQLTAILEAASGNTTDQILIIAIVTTRASLDEVRKLTTDCFINDQEKISVVVNQAQTNQTVIPVNQKYSSLIRKGLQRYGGLLFPGENNRKPMGRANVHLRLSKYKDAAGLPVLNHKILRATGMALYGDPNIPKPGTRHL